MVRRKVREAFARCTSEAKAAFGNGAVFVEEWINEARHIEIQAAQSHRLSQHAEHHLSEAPLMYP